MCHLIDDSLGTSHSLSQIAAQSVQPFCTADVTVCYTVLPHLPLTMWGDGPNLIHGSWTHYPTQHLL